MSLYSELKRRNVFRVAVAYVVVGWLIMQVAEVLVPALRLPDWTLTATLYFLLIGFLPALVFAWAFEMTPEGLRKEKEVDPSESITPVTGRKLDFAIITVLAVALGWFAWDKFGAERPTAAPAESSLAASAPRADGAASEKSVAVLPFVPLTSGPDDEYFADGLTEEILNSLAQLPELLITARTSAFAFKGRDLPIQEIASALGVGHIVEGSVRRSGEQLRVTAQLVRADDGFHLWSQNYDSTSDDTIAVQEDIAEQIALAMDVVLDEEKREAMRRAGLRDVEAFIAYQKGRDWYARSHGGSNQLSGLRQANEYFEAALERVPAFAPAWVAHSDLYVHILNNLVTGQDMTGVTEEELSSISSIIAHDYGQAMRHARSREERLAAELDLAFLTGNWQGIVGRLEQALGVTGCAEGNWVSPLADLFGYAERFAARAADLRECDPLVSTSWFNEARALLWAGDAEEALRTARQGAEVAPGGWLYMILMQSLIAEGRHAEANATIDIQTQIASFAHTMRALNAASQGQRQEFQEHFDRFLAEPDASTFWTVLLHAWGGQRDEANALAAEMDAAHELSEVPLLLLVHWCLCGAPWDLEATPGFAAKLEEGNLPWPPPSPINFPLKGW